MLIGQQVTIGGLRQVQSSSVTEDDVFLSVGCKVLGDVTVGATQRWGLTQLWCDPCLPAVWLAGFPREYCVKTRTHMMSRLVVTLVRSRDASTRAMRAWPAPGLRRSLGAANSAGVA